MVQKCHLSVFLVSVAFLTLVFSCLFNGAKNISLLSRRRLCGQMAFSVRCIETVTRQTSCILWKCRHGTTHDEHIFDRAWVREWQLTKYVQYIRAKSALSEPHMSKAVFSGQTVSYRAKRQAIGLVNFSPAVECHLCLALLQQSLYSKSQCTRLRECCSQGGHK